MLYSLTFNGKIISALHIARQKCCMVYAVIVTAVILSLTIFLRLVAKETNFSPPFTPELALKPCHAYRFNPLVRRNSDLV